MCECDDCYSGPACDIFCSGRGTLCQDDGMCFCGYDGWRGDHCEIEGCPGDPTDCSERGVCGVGGRCFCDPGWNGIDCNNVVCKDNCNYRGQCKRADQPYCECQSGYFGTACEYQCLHGQVIANNCTCEDCYSGFYCESLCSGIGNWISVLLVFLIGRSKIIQNVYFAIKSV